ncbi:GGDEF domain-containing protein [Photobacterium satsumensis]|uniref:GGDEF domain-containing protein n=1 Tax=Photobacterium satsumensis TaxID=2910239 RepID=UPI003D0F826D
MIEFPKIQLDPDNTFASDFGILIHDEFKILYVDENLCNIIGIGKVPDKVSLPNLLSLIVDVNPEQALAHHHRLMEGSERPRVQSFKVTKPSGKVAHVLAAESIVQWQGKTAIQLAIIDITEKYNDFYQLEQQASIDSLSGLTTRNRFETILSNELSKAQKLSYPISCLYIDIDDFKLINDTYGHQTGDDVIRLFADCCKSSIRQSDFIGRWGGEEFIILLPHTTHQFALLLAERLRWRVSKLEVDMPHGAISFTVSIGVNTLYDEVISPACVLNQADQALAYAKRHGKDQVASYKKLDTPDK